MQQEQIKNKRMTMQEAEDKFCIAREVDCDGEYIYEMSNEQIKECYLANSIHTDKFIKGLEHQIKRTKKQLDNTNSKSPEHMLLLGMLHSFRTVLNMYYNN